MQLSEIDTQTSLRSAHTCKIGKVFKERRQLLSLSETEVASKIFVNVNLVLCMYFCHFQYSNY